MFVVGGGSSGVLAWSAPAVWSRAPAPPPVFTWRFKCVAACGKESSLHIDSLCRVSAFLRPQLLLKSIQQAFTEGGEWLVSMPSLLRASCLSAGEGCLALLFPPAHGLLGSRLLGQVDFTVSFWPQSQKLPPVACWSAGGRLTT